MTIKPRETGRYCLSTIQAGEYLTVPAIFRGEYRVCGRSIRGRAMPGAMNGTCDSMGNWGRASGTLVFACIFEVGG